MQSKQMKISKAIALCSAAMIVTAFTLNTTAQAVIQSCSLLASGGTGCETGSGCPWWKPNAGITWNAPLSCGYDGNRLTYASVGNCYLTLNGGCCNNIDTQLHCPDASQCPSSPPATGCTTQGGGYPGGGYPGG